MPFVSHTHRDDLPDAGAVLGVDVGFSPTRRSSAMCRLDWTRDKVCWTIERFRARDDDLASVARRVAGAAPLVAAAFDGRLKADLAPITAYRRAEQLLTVRFQSFIGKPGQSSAPVGQALHRQTVACARAVLTYGQVAAARHRSAIHDLALIEAFPSSFLGLMIEDPKALITQRGNRSDVYYDHLARAGVLAALVGRFLPGRVLATPFDAVTNHDDRAALVCALTALCVAAGQFTAVGDDEGWIILPPRDLYSAWAKWLDTED